MTEVTPSKNSMFYWWSKVEALPIPKPKTVLIRHEDAFRGRLSLAPLDGEPDPAFDKMIEEAKKAADEMGYPVFIRSDQYSGKHSWKDTCYVERREDVWGHVRQILEEIEMMMMGPSFFGVAVREFLELDWRFTSHYGMPVAAERRYFVRDGKVECWHPYWPPAAIQEPSIRNWRRELKKLQTSTKGEIRLLTGYAEKVGQALGGYWSIDFCRGRNLHWYLTDMALGEDSYHWATCPHAPKEMLEQYGDPEKREESS